MTVVAFVGLGSMGQRTTPPQLHRLPGDAVKPCAASRQVPPPQRGELRAPSHVARAGLERVAPSYVVPQRAAGAG